MSRKNRLQKPDNKNHPDQERKPDGKWVAIVVAFITFFGGISALQPGSLLRDLIAQISAPTPTPRPTSTVIPTPLPPIEIVAPRNGDSVPHQISITGLLHTELCADCKVYVVIRPVVAEERTHWYGQSAAAALQPNSQFFLDQINIGRDVRADACKEFEVWAVVSTAPLQEIRMDEGQWAQVVKIASAMVRVQRECLSPP